jgi:hypothetical protein
VGREHHLSLAIGERRNPAFPPSGRRLGEASLAYGYGVWYFFIVVMLLIGPIVAGYLYDATGSYTMALVVLATSATAAGLIGLFTAAGTPVDR